MQHSPYEIKDKLLQALDHEYNVVDMAGVLEVIAALEKACITKEALEKTRIGRYINELRKRTNNEQLARRAKDLVKSWRKLLPQTAQRVNGEETISSIASSPGTLTVLGPGPGPGFGPGPGPGNKTLKSVSVPGTPRYKTSSPSILGERSSSPYFSSASNSPLLNSIHQGSNLPSNYAPLNLSQVNLHGEKANCINKGLLNASNQSKNVTSSQTFKPISPSLALKQTINTLSSGTSVLPSQRTSSPNVSPGLRTSSSSSSTSVNLCSQNVSPTLSRLFSHSILDIDQTNVANKRLRKEKNNSSIVPKEQVHCNSKSRIGNGTTELMDNILPDESSVFKKNVFNSNSNNDSDEVILVTSVKTPKRKRSFDKKELRENRLGEMIASLPSGSKLPKVKTTQQLIEDFHTEKSGNLVSPKSFSSLDALNASEAEVSRTKSELLKKFLNAQSVKPEINQEIPTDDSSVSVTSDYGSHSVPDVSSVINKNFDVSTSISHHPDPMDEEVRRILLALPPINSAEINLEDDYPSVNHPNSVTNNDLNKLSEPWEFVNGLYDCNGTWRSWQECCEQKSLGESFLLLPYVNID